MHKAFTRPAGRLEPQVARSVRGHARAVAELDALVQLQAIDSEIDQKKARIEVLRAALGPTEAARASVANQPPVKATANPRRRERILFISF